MGRNLIKNKNCILIIYGFLVVYAAILLFFCTKSSPLYVLNDWYDANAYFTMGKGLMNGAVPYKDLFDHKGPLLYLLYGLGYLVDHTGFIGVFLIQIIFMSLAVIFTFKIAKLYMPNSLHALIASMFMPIIALSKGFYVSDTNFGGGCPEEFILALLAISLYLIIKFFKDKEANGYTNIKSTMFFVGLISGFIFLLKFNFIAFSFGLLVPILIYLMIKNIKVFLKSLLFIFIGLIAALLPYLIYALITNSIHDFVEVYLKFNLAYSAPPDTNFLYSIAVGLKNTITLLFNDNLVYGTIILFGLLYFIFKDRKNTVLNCSIFLSFILMLIAISVKPFGYVYIPIAAFSIFGYLGIYDVFKKLKQNYMDNNDCHPKRKHFLSVFTMCLIFIFTVGNNGLIMTSFNRVTQINQIPFQQQVADMILDDTDENHSVLEVLTLDCGVYAASNLVPKSKYFYIPNITFEQYPQVFIGQYDDINSKKNAYLVCPFQANYDGNINEMPMNKDTYYQKIQNAIVNNYDLVNVVKGTYLQDGTTYYLYKRT